MHTIGYTVLMPCHPVCHLFILSSLICQRQFLFSNDLHVIFSSDKKEILSLLIHRFLISDARFSSRHIENYSFVCNSKLVLSVRSLTATFRHRFIKIHIATEIYLFAYRFVWCVFECLIGHRLLNWL